MKLCIKFLLAMDSPSEYMIDDHPHEGPIANFAYQKIQKINARINRTWFQNRPGYEQTIQYIFNILSIMIWFQLKRVSLK